MIDRFDGLVVSWSMGTRPGAELVNTMLDAAVESVADNEHRPIVHSDRGARPTVAGPAGPAGPAG